LANDAVQQTALALIGDGNPLVVYRGVKDGHLYFQRSSDGGATWDQPAKIPGVEALDTIGRGLDIYSLATDSADYVHLVMVGFRDGEVRAGTAPRLMHLTWDGHAWSDPETLMQRADYQPEWPRIVVSGGNRLHVVWFTRHDLPTQTADEDQRLYQVWYSSESVNSPALPPEPFFTPMPTLTVQPTPALPTPRALPTLQRVVTQSPPISDRPAWESAGMVTIGLALVPCIGLLVLLLVLVRHAQAQHD
jgi:hypothetical protein